MCFLLILYFTVKMTLTLNKGRDQPAYLKSLDYVVLYIDIDYSFLLFRLEYLGILGVFLLCYGQFFLLCLFHVVTHVRSEFLCLSLGKVYIARVISLYIDFPMMIFELQNGRCTL